MLLILSIFFLLIINSKNKKIDSLFNQIITNEKIYELSYVPLGLELRYSITRSFKKVNNLIHWLTANRELMRDYCILEIPKINGKYPKWIDEKECEDYDQ